MSYRQQQRNIDIVKRKRLQIKKYKLLLKHMLRDGQADNNIYTDFSGISNNNNNNNNNNNDDMNSSNVKKDDHHAVSSNANSSLSAKSRSHKNRKNTNKSSNNKIIKTYHQTQFERSERKRLQTERQLEKKKKQLFVKQSIRKRNDTYKKLNTLESRAILNETDRPPSPPAPLIPSFPPLIVTPDMCYFCFDVLIAHLYKQHVGYTPSFTNTAYPLFVTWKIEHEFKLRGCIGTFDPLPLHRGLVDYSIKSAMEDNRFQPVTLSEIPKMNCGVSLLINFQSGKHYLDWEVGVHGITIDFTDNHKKPLRATYLPEVAIEQAWSKEETIRSLMKKAGLKCSITQEIVDSISLTRYNSVKYTVSYREYIDLWYNQRT